MRRPNSRPLTSTVALVLALGLTSPLASTSCTPETPVAPSQGVLDYAITPPTGTPAVRGNTLSIVVTLRQVPKDVHQVVLRMSVVFERPDGVVDNSYLPGVSDGPETSWHGTLPATLHCAFVVPTGTPEGNSFIPPGSRLLELRANLYTEDDALHSGGGPIATYPVVGQAARAR